MTAIVALAAVFSLAICFIILGSISSDLMQALNIDAGQFGTLVMALFLTGAIVQFFIGPLVDKLGYKPVAITGFIVTTLSLFLLAFSATFAIALASSILLGIGAMCLNTVGNTLNPVVLFDGKDPARAANFGNAFFGLGYIVTPLIVVFIVKTLGLDYRTALIVLGILTAGFLVLTLFTSFPQVPVGFSFSTAFKQLLRPVVIIAALALFCYISLEITMGTWIKKVMEELYGGSAGIDASAKAGFVLSLFGVSMMVGRFLTSAIKDLTSKATTIIILASVLSLAAILIMIFAKGPVMGIVAVLLVGIAFAPIFPTIVGITFAKSSPAFYGSIFGIIFAIGLLGSTFIPKIIGNLSVGSTTQQSLSIAAVMAGILLVISLFIGRVGKSGSK